MSGLRSWTGREFHRRGPGLDQIHRVNNVPLVTGWSVDKRSWSRSLRGDAVVPAEYTTTTTTITAILGAIVGVIRARQDQMYPSFVTRVTVFSVGQRGHSSQTSPLTAFV